MSSHPFMFTTSSNNWSETLSKLFGWGYFLAWSLSFYAQPRLMYTRQSAKGLSMDFQYLNLLGFTCYTVYNLSMHYGARVRNDVSIQNHGVNPELVRLNDVAFALHALLLTAITTTAACRYGDATQLSRFNKILIAVVLIFLFFFGLMTLEKDYTWDVNEKFWFRNVFTSLGWVTLASGVKLGVTCVKYVPQFVDNCRRRSTEGWAIENILLDFTGGVLSLMQLLLDASNSGDWHRITDNPVKFGLGFVTMLFDILFMLQHYVWFSKDDKRIQSNSEDEESTQRQDENTSLLDI